MVEHPDIVTKYGDFSGELLCAMLGISIVESKKIFPIEITFNSVMISFPNIPLVRSMRRCDRKLLPTLDHWSVVDVVLTQYELVCFAANDDIDNIERSLITKECRDAIVTSKGGKGPNNGVK
jgi:hypothetical protein